MSKLTLKICSITLIGAALLGLQSCSEDAMPGDGEALTAAELHTVLSVDEVSGVTDSALADLYATTTGKMGSAFKMNECYTAEYTDTGFVATFNNCVLNGTDNVNGTVTVTYEMGTETASFTATYVDFYVGTVKLNGTRTFVANTNGDQNSISFTVTSDMTVEMEDGSVISEAGTRSFSFTFGADLASTTYSISGNWTVMAEGNTYAVETLEALAGNAACGYVTSGSMVVSKNGLAVTVDFGNGDCDDKATLIYPNGATEEITL